ncbi:hypothetical protein AB6805_13480 [Chitinophaga sp. RCC_12]|uniref:hypothetical protein n=1 Tax=Chitinophaga sp. RCC_12 TaxID=3239226 RepID=UPI003525AD5E
MDFNDLFKDIEHLDPIRMKSMYEYLRKELQPVIESIKGNHSQDENYLIDVTIGMEQSLMPNYSLWRSKVILKTETISVPVLYSDLNTFLAKPAQKIQFLPIFNESFRISQSNKQILYLHKLQKTHIQNYFYGNAMLLEPS